MTLLNFVIAVLTHFIAQKNGCKAKPFYGGAIEIRPLIRRGSRFVATADIRPLHQRTYFVKCTHLKNYSFML